MRRWRKYSAGDLGMLRPRSVHFSSNRVKFVHNLNENYVKSHLLINLMGLLARRFKIHTKSFRPILVMNMTRMNFSSLSGGSSAGHQQRRNQLLMQHRVPEMLAVVPVRRYGMLVVRVLRGALKLRYLVLGGAITGGMTFNKKYEEWKDGLPDFKWLNDVLPDNEQWSSFSKSIKDMSANVGNSIELGAIFTSLGLFFFERDFR